MTQPGLNVGQPADGCWYAQATEAKSPAGAVSQVPQAATNWEATMYSTRVPQAHATLTGPRVHPARGEAATGRCDCLDWRVHGHVCASLAPPSQGEDNAWRDIPALRDPAPRPEPAPGDWLPGLPLHRGACHPAAAAMAETAAA